VDSRSLKTITFLKPTEHGRTAKDGPVAFDKVLLEKIMQNTSFNSDQMRPILNARREKLLHRLGDTPALIPAGNLVGKNYPGNPYRFRPSSHFIYCIGEDSYKMPGSWLFFNQGKTTLFTHAPDPNDALWHGARPLFAELAERHQVNVQDVRSMEESIGKCAPATICATDRATQTQQEQIIKRSVQTPNEADFKLQDALIDLRLRHDAAAQWDLRRAADATGAAHVEGMKATKPGVREWEIRAAMEAELLKRGMGVSYNPIVSVHGEVLHNNYYENIVSEDDLVLADVGAETQGGFAGDVTRTWPVSGKYDAAQKAIYEVVLQSQLDAIGITIPGTGYRDIHMKACMTLTEGLVDLGILKGSPEDLVAEDVHALFFPHGVGHIIGLDVHDMEDLGDRAGYAPGRTRSERFGLCYLRLDRDLEPGMAVTIEPGFYQVPAILKDPERVGKAKDVIQWSELEKYSHIRGIRIEDDILVTNGAPEVLTESIPKTVAEVEDAMLHN
jgi:Xaa-Pro aminopeptidase